MPSEIDYIGEGLSDDAVARQLIVTAAGAPGTSYTRRPRSGTGKSNLDRRISGLNAGAMYRRPLLILRDLDEDAACPIELVRKILPDKHPNVILRICVKEVETWLMADYAAYADYCGVPEGRIPANLEKLADPKELLQTWVSRGSARPLSRHLEYAAHRGVPLWAALGQWHGEFASKFWRPKRAAGSNRAPSLSKALHRLEEMVRA